MINNHTEKEYNFDFEWLNMIFYKKSLFKRQDIINLLKHFGIGIVDDETNTTEDLSVILVVCSDIQEQELVILAKKLMKESYPNLPSYDDIFEIYQQLLNLDIEALAILYNELSNDEQIKEIIEHLLDDNKRNIKQFSDEYTKNEILYFILESLYKTPPRQLTKEGIINYIKKLDL